MRTLDECLYDYNNNLNGGYTTSYDPDTNELVLGSDDPHYSPYRIQAKEYAHWSQELDAFFMRNKDRLIYAPDSSYKEGISIFIWDDYRDVKEYVDKHYPQMGNRHIYTIVTEDDDEAYLRSNSRWVNRIMWLVSDQPIEPNVCIRFW